jgi:hypothetical protein
MMTKMLSAVPLLFLYLIFVSPLQAFESGSEPADSTTSSAAPQEHPSGFWLRPPRFFLGGHAGIGLPRAGSDLFDMVTRELTLDKGDFRSPAVGFDFGVPIRSHFAAVFSFEYARTSPDSESRNYLEDNGLPIRQTTTFVQMPITATLRFYPRKMGETIGNYAWVPARFLPYIGGGGGFMWYRFRQQGDFVDSTTLNIFSNTFKSSGPAATEHVAAGTDIALTKRIIANVEMRYSWAHANLSRSFTGFQPIDLAGLRVIGGVYFRF